MSKPLNSVEGPQAQPGDRSVVKGQPQWKRVEGLGCSPGIVASQVDCAALGECGNDR